MNKIIAWYSENRIAATLVTVLILATGVLGWLVFTAWDEYNTATAEYAANSSELTKLSQQKPFPSKENSKKLAELIAREQSDLEKLTKRLQRYSVTTFGDIEKVKPQDRPQRFQDALRTEVTKIKSLAAEAEATLPPGFYLGMEEYENKPPAGEEVINLSKQLTVLSWIAQTLVSQKGLILAEFARGQAESTMKKEGGRKAPTAAITPKGDTPYEAIGTARISLRCTQGSFRDLINSISSAPYFLIIEGMQIQNSSGEPPRREMATNQTTEPPQEGATPVQRLPIVVGRELLNVSLKIRAVEFPEPQQRPSAAK